MGAWGTGTFDNDDAADWLYELTDAGDPESLRAALESTEIGEGYLEALEASRVLVACEIVAALCGNPAPDLPEEARNWVGQHSGLDVSSLVPVAIGGIDRILAESSELNELWSENQAEYPAWRGNVLDLRSRLG